MIRLELRDACVTYESKADWLGRRDSAKIKVVGPFSVSVSSGERLHVRGRNGVGKSALLRLAGGLHGTLAGQRVANGRCLFLNGGTFIPNGEALHLQFETLGAVLGATRPLGPAGFERALEDADLEPAWAATHTRMSPGQRQRLAFAAMLAVARRGDAEIFVLDDPLTESDDETNQRLVSALSSALSEDQCLLATGRPFASLGNRIEFRVDQGRADRGEARTTVSSTPEER